MDALQRQGRHLVAAVREHPYQALLVAAGIGYVLGGGLFTRLTLTAIQVGVRMGALPIVQQKLLGVAESVASHSVAAPETQ